MSIWQSVKNLFRLTLPAVVDEAEQTIKVPAFVIPLAPEPLEGVIKVEVEPETKAATVKVELRRKVKTPAAKKKLAPKTAKKKAK